MHHHLIRDKTRTRTGLIVESGDARECHHIALLIGYGAAAVCPYLALASAADLARRGVLGQVTVRKAEANVIKALGKGLLKIMSKMGVSTVASYTGAQIFEAIGLGAEVVGECFAGTPSRLGGVGFDVLAAEAAARHARAFPPRGARPAHRRLETGGNYQWRRDGEPHLFSPEAVFRLQHATRTGRRDVFAEYTDAGGRPVGPADDAPRPAAHPRRRRRCRRRAAPAARRSRWRRSSRSSPSSGGSAPARCPTGRSRPRRTRRWRSR